MKKLTVKVTDPTCPLESVELEYEWMHVKAKGPDGTERVLSARMFAPKSVNGGHNQYEFYIERMSNLYENSDGEDAEYYGWILRTLAAGSVMFNLDSKHERKFSVKTLANHSDPSEQTTFDSLRKTIGATGIPSLELMLRLNRDRDKDGKVEELVDAAIFTHPRISTPLSENCHHEFLEQLIDDILTLREKAAKFVHEEIKTRERKIKSDRSLSASASRKMLRELREAVPDCIRHIVAETTREVTIAEEQFTTRFADFVAEARRMHDEMSPHLVSAGMIGEDGKVYASETDLRALLRERLDVAGVDVILDGLMARLCEVEEKSDANNTPANGDCAVSIGTFTESTNEIQRVLTDARNGSDPIEKWDALLTILTQFVNRNESTRLFQREYDAVFRGMLDGVYREIYRAIRTKFTRPERRLFLLMYCALPGLGGRMSATDLPIQSFY